jgi:hypothetical protein
VTPSATVVQQSGTAFVVRLRWRPQGESAEQERFQMLATRDGKVYEMRDYLTEREATKAAKARAAG